MVHFRPFRGGLHWHGIALWLPRARDGIFHCVLNFFPADVTPTVLHPAFEQGDHLHGWQMCMKLASNAEKPIVDAFTGTRRRGEHFINE
jgi:hypothetical protein